MAYDREVVELEFSPSLKHRVPVLRIRGAVPGPRLTLVAGQHGRELNGVEAVRRVFEEVAPQSLHGTLTGIPVANPFGMKRRQHSHPDDRYWTNGCVDREANLNRCWPGDASKEGYPRVAAQLWEHIQDSDVVIDYHAWGRWQVPEAIANLGPQENLDLAVVFGLPGVQVHGGPGRLQTTIDDFGMLGFSVELAGQFYLTEDAVRLGVRGAMNVMKYIGMLEGRPELPLLQRRAAPHVAQENIKASVTGLVRHFVQPNEDVDVGQPLGEIRSFESLEVTQSFRSPMRGYVRLMGPGSYLIHESSIARPGDTVYVVTESAPIRPSRPALPLAAVRRGEHQSS